MTGRNTHELLADLRARYPRAAARRNRCPCPNCRQGRLRLRVGDMSDWVNEKIDRYEQVVKNAQEAIFTAATRPFTMTADMLRDGASAMRVEAQEAWQAGERHLMETATEIANRLAAAAAGAGKGMGDMWKNFFGAEPLTTLLAGWGIALVVLAGGGYLLLSGGGQQLLIGGGSLLGGAGKALGKVL